MVKQNLLVFNKDSHLFKRFLLDTVWAFTKFGPENSPKSPALFTPKIPHLSVASCSLVTGFWEVIFHPKKMHQKFASRGSSTPPLAGALCRGCEALTMCEGLG